MISNLDSLGQLPNDTAELAGIETYTPSIAQAAVDAAMTEYVNALEQRIKRLEMAMVGAQLYCRMQDSRAAYAVLSAALSSL